MQTRLTLTALFAIGTALGASAVTAQEVEITFAHFLANASTEAPNVADALARFREKYPGVTVNEQISGTDEYLTQFNVGAASGEVPDVFMMNGSDTTALVAAGLVGAITEDFMADPEWGGITPEGMTFEFSRDGEIYAVPYGQIITHVIYWNADLFAQAGIEEFPTDWDGFLGAIDALNAAGIQPISLGNKGRWVVVDPYMSTLAYRHEGPDMVSDLLSGDAALTDAGYVAALQNMQQLVDAGAFNGDMNSLDNQQQRAAYFNGEAAMFVEGSWAVPGIIENATPEVLAATNMAIWPEIDGNADYADIVSGGAGWSYALAARLDGAEREAAINLLRELSSVEYSRSRLEIGLLPAQNLGDLAEGIEVHPLLAQLVENISSGDWVVAPIPATNLPRSFLDLSGEALQDMMVGNKTPEEVAADLQDDLANNL